jgi:hypothetical protein
VRLSLPTSRQRSDLVIGADPIFLHEAVRHLPTRVEVERPGEAVEVDVAAGAHGRRRGRDVEGAEPFACRRGEGLHRAGDLTRVVRADASSPGRAARGIHERDQAGLRHEAVTVAAVSLLVRSITAGAVASARSDGLPIVTVEVRLRRIVTEATLQLA